MASKKSGGGKRDDEQTVPKTGGEDARPRRARPARPRLRADGGKEAAPLPWSGARTTGGASGASRRRPKPANDAPRPGRRPDAPRDPRRGPDRTSARPAPAAPRQSPPLKKAPLAPPRRAGKRPDERGARETEPSAHARELALAIAAEGIEKKAIGIEILDVCGRVDYADFLVVMTGRSDRHVHAIATGIEEALGRRRIVPLSMEGLTAASWVLIDYGDCVVHVFQEDSRRLYDIEGLWIDAERVPVPPETGPSPDAR